MGEFCQIWLEDLLGTSFSCGLLEVLCVSFAHVLWGDEYAHNKTGRVAVMETVFGVTECYKGVHNFSRRAVMHLAIIWSTLNVLDVFCAGL